VKVEEEVEEEMEEEVEEEVEEEAGEKMEATAGEGSVSSMSMADGREERDNEEEEEPAIRAARTSANFRFFFLSHGSGTLNVAASFG
jgi:hypothetical protein